MPPEQPYGYLLVNNKADVFEAWLSMKTKKSLLIGQLTQPPSDDDPNRSSWYHQRDFCLSAGPLRPSLDSRLRPLADPYEYKPLIELAHVPGTTEELIIATTLEEAVAIESRQATETYRVLHSFFAFDERGMVTRALDIADIYGPNIENAEFIGAHLQIVSETELLRLRIEQLHASQVLSATGVDTTEQIAERAGRTNRTAAFLDTESALVGPEPSKDTRALRAELIQEIAGVLVMAPFMTEREYAAHTEPYRGLFDGFPGDDLYLGATARADYLAELQARGLTPRASMESASETFIQGAVLEVRQPTDAHSIAVRPPRDQLLSAWRDRSGTAPTTVLEPELQSGSIGEAARQGGKWAEFACFLQTGAKMIRTLDELGVPDTGRLAGRLASAASAALDLAYSPDLLRQLGLERSGDRFGFIPCGELPTHHLRPALFEMPEAASTSERFMRLAEVTRLARQFEHAANVYIDHRLDQLRALHPELRVPHLLSVSFDVTKQGLEQEHLAAIAATHPALRHHYVDLHLVGLQHGVVDTRLRDAYKEMDFHLLERSGIGKRGRNDELLLDWNNWERFESISLRGPVKVDGYISDRLVSALNRPKGQRSARLRDAVRHAQLPLGRIDISTAVEPVIEELRQEEIAHRRITRSADTDGPRHQNKPEGPGGFGMGF